MPLLLVFAAMQLSRRAVRGYKWMYNFGSKATRNPDSSIFPFSGFTPRAKALESGLVFMGLELLKAVDFAHLWMNTASFALTERSRS